MSVTDDQKYLYAKSMMADYSRRAVVRERTPSITVAANSGALGGPARTRPSLGRLTVAFTNSIATGASKQQGHPLNDFRVNYHIYSNEGQQLSGRGGGQLIKEFAAGNIQLKLQQ